MNSHIYELRLAFRISSKNAESPGMFLLLIERLQITSEDCEMTRIFLPELPLVFSSSKKEQATFP